MLLLSHPTGTQNMRAAARAFLDAGWLKEFDTCFSWDPTVAWTRLLPISTGFRRQLERRSFDDIPRQLQHTHPWREIARLATRSLPVLAADENAPFSVDTIYHSLDRHVARRIHSLSAMGLRGVYSYEDCALQTFEAAKKRGLRCFYELPYAYWKATYSILREECDLKPEWATTIPDVNHSDNKLYRKDHELQLADLVVVPSIFVRDSLINNNAPCAKISVVPYGSPQPLDSYPARRDYAGPLRVLFAGQLVQRKGLAYLLEAIDQLGSDVQLTLIGMPVSNSCRPLQQAIERHRWIPSIPHSEVLQEMRRHDVLVLPSLVEGYALVIGEALSQGLPVIATYNSGATESIRDGVEGWIVPIRSGDAIAQRLIDIQSNREQLAAMRKACLRRAAELSWKSYQASLVNTLAHFLYTQDTADTVDSLAEAQT